MSTSKTTHVQTRNPRALQFDPAFHYVKVDLDSYGIDSRVDEFLDMDDPLYPGEAMYEMAFENRKETGSTKRVILRCRKESWDKQQEIYHAATQGAERALSQPKDADGNYLEVARTKPIRLGETPTNA